MFAKSVGQENKSQNCFNQKQTNKQTPQKTYIPLRGHRNLSRFWLL